MIGSNRIKLVSCGRLLYTTILMFTCILLNMWSCAYVGARFYEPASFKYFTSKHLECRWFNKTHGLCTVAIRSHTCRSRTLFNQPKQITFSIHINNFQSKSKSNAILYAVNSVQYYKPMVINNSFWPSRTNIHLFVFSTIYFDRCFFYLHFLLILARVLLLLFPLFSV